jgi:hypothetical protein
MDDSQRFSLLSYYLFKADIMPAWEDPNNGSGGNWVLQLGNTPQDKNKLDEVCYNFAAVSLLNADLVAAAEKSESF